MDAMTREESTGKRSPFESFGRGERVRPSDPVYLEILGFLWDEAATLDQDDLTEWLSLLDEDITYIMPVRVTRKRGTGSEFDPAMMHFDEDIASLRFRVRRFLETTAWSEDPPSRVRRTVTAVRVYRTDAPHEFEVTNSLLLVRTQDDDYRLDIVTAERRDRVRRYGDDSFKLAQRTILLDQATVSTPNLAIFL
ncbi:MAG: hypothetical protein JWL73_2862 [Actinomycetia bacterium]|nr:hypothetical protein [Actinomycetes bacterium]